MKLKITVHGVAYEVDVEVLEAEGEFAAGGPLPHAHHAPAPAAPAPAVAPAAPAPAPVAPVSGYGVLSPIAGTVLEVKCRPGDQVAAGQALLVIEAMKMETAIAAPRDGRVKAVPVAAGDAVRESQLLVDFE